MKRKVSEKNTWKRGVVSSPEGLTAGIHFQGNRACMQDAVIAYPGNSLFPGVCYCEDRGVSTFVCTGNSYPLGILLGKRFPSHFCVLRMRWLISALHMWCVGLLFTSCVHHGINGLTPLDPVGKLILSSKFCFLFCIVRLKSVWFNLLCVSLNFFFTSFRMRAIIWSVLELKTIIFFTTHIESKWPWPVAVV